MIDSVRVLGVQHSEDSNWLWVYWEDTKAYTLCFGENALIH